MRDILIRPLETIAEFREAEDLQRQVWPGSELEVVPLHVLTTAAHNGGLALGAWDGERLVGFLFGFLGTDEGDPSRLAMTRLKHCSHMLGVLPEYRDRGVGYRLKLAQRDAVQQQGIRLITWTFDPLESRNANLNIARLGAISQTYRRDVYGQMADGLNAGLASDRLEVEWWITSQRVKQRLAGDRRRLSYQSFVAAETTVVNPTRLNAAGLVQIVGGPGEPLGVLSLVEIPPEFQALKAADRALAAEWRSLTRSIFDKAFEAGYIVTDFLHDHDPAEDRARAFYVLSQTGARLLEDEP